MLEWKPKWSMCRLASIDIFLNVRWMGRICFFFLLSTEDWLDLATQQDMQKWRNHMIFWRLTWRASAELRVHSLIGTFDTQRRTQRGGGAASISSIFDLLRRVSSISSSSSAATCNWMNHWIWLCARRGNGAEGHVPGGGHLEAAVLDDIHDCDRRHSRLLLLRALRHLFCWQLLSRLHSLAHLSSFLSLQ